MSSPVLNHAARILKRIQTSVPADQALRESLTQDRHFTDPAGRRAVSRAVFPYFRWWRWLAPKDSLQKQAEAPASLNWRMVPAAYQELRAHPAVAGNLAEARRPELKEVKRWGKKSF